jgi:hypothetical protein
MREGKQPAARAVDGSKMASRITYAGKRERAHMRVNGAQ